MAAASSLSKWQQGAQAAAEALDTIEIDPQVAQSYGFKDGTTVEIGLVHNLPIATSVETVPLSSDDWEILETHAEYVEQNLLGQFRVVSTKPEGQAVLLGPDTEVAIAPKLRAPPSTAKSQPRKISEGKYPMSEAQSESHFATSPHDPLPWPCVYSLLDPSVPEAFISFTDIEKLSVQKPSSSSLTHAWLAAPSPVVLQQNKEKKQGEAEPRVPGVLVRVKAQDGVPVGHGIVVGLEGKLQDWDTVLLSYSDNGPEQTSRSSSPSQTTATEVQVQKPRIDNEANELAGVDGILSECHEFFVRTYMQPRAFGTAGGSQLPGLLLHGATGSGKTSVAKSVAKKLEVDPCIHACIVYVDLAQMADEHTSSLRSKFKTWRSVAAWRRPSVLVLDNLDKVVSAEVEHTDSSRARHLAEHFLDVFASAPAPGVAILASCTSPSALHPLLNASHVFAHKVQLRAPDKNARRDILSRIVKRRFATSDLSSDSERPLGGKSGACRCGSVSERFGQLACTTSRRLCESSGRFVPLSLRGVKLQKSDVSWSDIGGLEETRRVLRETLEWPTKYGAIFAKCPLRLRSGLLLYGVKGPELLNKYIGQSEQSVRDIFDRASAAKPCVLFLDEFDSIAPKRGHDSTGVTDRVVNQMLTQMDGAEGLDGVYVLAATSRPDLIDPALLRPGRLDKSLLCHMPTEQEREEILRAVSRKVSLAPDVDLSVVAKRTEGFSGADIQALVYNAQLEVVHEELAVASRELSTSGKDVEEKRVKVEIVGGNGTTMTRAESAALEKRVATILAARAPKRDTRRKTGAGEEKQKKPSQITLAHLERSLENHRPSVSPEERFRLQAIYDAFQTDRTGEHRVPPGLSGVGGRATLG
ncbi:AAA family ATPase [Ceratobasidium sp. AG-Ba]|nr:AAA family ATPase [Ceratobasidium sp. AG-Ba]